MFRLIKNISNRTCVLLLLSLVSLNFDSVYRMVCRLFILSFHILEQSLQHWLTIKNLTDFTNIYLQILSSLLTITAVTIAIVVFLTKNFEKSLGDVLRKIDEILDNRIKKNNDIVQKKTIMSDDSEAYIQDYLKIESYLLKYRNVYNDLEKKNVLLHKISIAMFHVTYSTIVILVIVLFANEMVNPLSILVVSTEASMLWIITKIIHNLDRNQRRSFAFPDYEDLIDLEYDGRYFTCEAIYNSINHKMLNAFSWILIKRHTYVTKALLGEKCEDDFYLEFEVSISLKFNGIFVSMGDLESDKKSLLVNVKKNKDNSVKERQYISVDWKELKNVFTRNSSNNYGKNSINILISSKNGKFIKYVYCLVNDPGMKEVLFLPIYRRTIGNYYASKETGIEFCDTM